ACSARFWSIASCRTPRRRRGSTRRRVEPDARDYHDGLRGLAYHHRGLLEGSPAAMSPRRWITAIGVFGAIALVAAGVAVVVRQQAQTALEKSSQERLGLLAAGLRSTIDRYEPVPALIGESVVVRWLVESPAAA